MGATRGAGTAQLYGAIEFIPLLCVRIARSLALLIFFYKSLLVPLPFVFVLAIVLFPRFTASDCSFCTYRQTFLVSESHI